MKKASFTLLEVISVLVIISILVLAAGTSYHKAILRGRERIALENKEAIEKALKIYYLNYGSYPKELSNEEEINATLHTAIKDNYFDYSTRSENVIVKDKNGDLLNFND